MQRTNGSDQDFAYARSAMVTRHLRHRDIVDERVLAAMSRVPREDFVGPELREFAYQDTPLPIEEGQTISQPYIVALMAQLAKLQPSDRVLEIGTGSGYAAAVFAALASEVVTVERHAPLANAARRRLEEHGLDNVRVVIGDGSAGWPDAAPFDAIIVAAAAPEVPVALREQLLIGGRLVIPVGDRAEEQRLLRITRTGAATYQQEDLGGVRFVPLVGRSGWSDRRSRHGNHARSQGSVAEGSVAQDPVVELINQAAEPLPPPHTGAFCELFDRYADKRIVLLGESTHGTAEFYRARAAITRHLVECHGFGIVAVEADWPDAAAVDRYARDRVTVAAASPPFRRFPTWMWRNTDVQAFVEWLRAYNLVQPPAERAGFYGLDIYSLSASAAAVLDYLDRVDPSAAATARERYGCLTPWQKDPAVYGRSRYNRKHAECEHAVMTQLRELLDSRLEYARVDGDAFFDAAQNARLVTAAERYYRTMYYGAAQSWNLRDTHMFDTLSRLLESAGPQSKAVVWAHNSHIGDARATEMGRVRGELNLGQLCREHYGDEVACIGFGTHSGTVAAATDWDGPMEIKQVLPSLKGSVEAWMHEALESDFMLDFHAEGAADLRDALRTSRLQRFIGVIYRPETELQSHYMQASLSEQFDAWIWMGQTRAITALSTAGQGGVPDTYPFGL